ncbi:hypothetical protein [Parvibaculum sp.]|uniref:hypothetical protein n=1 Tax=Parvibaculum sp. TaxID=2024848 RepID=UPI00329A26EA
MKMKTAAMLLVAGAMLAGCQTTGLDTAALGNAALANSSLANTGTTQAGATSAGAALAGQMVADSSGTVTPAAAGIPDAQKSCEQLAAEMGAQQQLIAGANSTETNAQLVNAGVGIAQSLGLNFGGMGIGGLQAAGAVGNAASQQGQNAQAQAQQADIRLQVLTGFYQGKGCGA